MKMRIMAAAVLLLVATAAGDAAADSFKTLSQNVFTTAESMDAGLTQAGVHFSLGENYRSFYPAMRFGLGGMAEVGLKAGATTADAGSDDEIAFLAGVDLKFQMVKQTEGIPVDLALDLGFDNNIVNGKNVSEVTFAAIFSRSFPLTERGYKVTPYGGIQLASLHGSYFPKNETDYYAFFGAEWRVSQKSMFYAELKAGDDTVGGIGMRFEY